MNKEFLCYFTFHEELNYFLPVIKQYQNNPYHFDKNPSVKDAIEAQGVPHTEIEFIFVNSISVGFDYHLCDKDQIHVYSKSSQKQVSVAVNLRKTITGIPAFVVDVHLGKLARRLRFFGFDSLYDNNFPDSEIIKISTQTGRVVLTRDRKLLCHKLVTYGCCLHSQVVDEQAIEVFNRYDLRCSIRPFYRCTACNGVLKAVDKDLVSDQLEPKTKRYYDQFTQCDTCQKIYWKGSHFDKLKLQLDKFSF